MIGRRARLLLAAVTLVGSSLASAGAAQAGCGWPSCNPAKLHASFTKSITPPGGHTGNITVGFTSSDPYPGAETSVTFNGTSYARWLGSTPFNATSVGLTDHFHVDAILPSVGYPSGVGFTGSGGDVYWVDSDTNVWHEEHNFS